MQVKGSMHQLVHRTPIAADCARLLFEGCVWQNFSSLPSKLREEIEVTDRLTCVSACQCVHTLVRKIAIAFDAIVA